MLSWLVYPILLPLAVFLPEAVASHPTSNGKLPAAAADECTTFPSWTVTGFRSNSTDAVGGSGARASFTLTNNLSGTTDELACDLQVNYRCVIAGTPSDEGLTVHLAIRADSLTFQLAKVVAECPGRTTPLHVIAHGELPLDCVVEGGEEGGGTITCSLSEEANTIQGEAVELAPES